MNQREINRTSKPYFGEQKKKYQIVERQDDYMVLMEVGAADTDFQKRIILQR